jgi:hypothetical protein
VEEDDIEEEDDVTKEQVDVLDESTKQMNHT